MVVQPPKGTFIVPEFRKHFLKMSCESLVNYYLGLGLLAFIENIKYSPKKQHLFFNSETNNFFEKLRVAYHHKFLMWIWEKFVEVQKETI